MGNHYFEFKAFRIVQEHAPMKVCTDSCLLGAWAANILSENSDQFKKVVDIGTGTGLLSLMIAQRIPAEIHALEIDPGALVDASHNFNHSSWKHRLHLLAEPVQKFARNQREEFDAVVCNPPFFHDSLKSPKRGNNLAKHEENLSLTEVVRCIKTMLKPDGLAFLLLPFDRDPLFREIMLTEKLWVRESMEVKQSPAHRPFRYLYCIAKSEDKDARTVFLSIRTAEGGYTNEFSCLLKPYYLAL